VATITRLLDLHAGDTVKLTTQHNKGANASLWNDGSFDTPCRLVLQWMGASGVPSTLWTNPDPGFRWQAGTPGSQLTSLFNARLTNDLNFLVSKPYLLTYQTVAQTALAANTSVRVSVDHLGGRIHNDNGDNYSGWTGSPSYFYTAQRAGWYLVVGDYCTTSTTGGTAMDTAAQVTQNNGHQNSPLYWGQHMHWTTSFFTGATYVNLQYLRVGDTIGPNVQGQPAAGTWATAVSATQESNFGLIWLSQ